MPGQTKVHISPEGEVKMETTGVQGSGCEQKTQPYLDKLGINMTDANQHCTVEYNQEQTLEQDGVQ